MKKNIYLLMLMLASISTIYSQSVQITPVEFNSSGDDFGSILTQHGRVMYFTSERSGRYQKLFYVERTSGGWSVPEELTSEVNDGSQNGSVAITPDGQFMIFAAYEHGVDGQGRTDLYSAEKINGEWTNVQNLGPNVNSVYWDSNPTLTSDGEVLYFSSDRPGGKGETDIYMSKRSRSGWTEAKNVGSPINTASSELAPVIGSDNKLLTFSSNRDGGNGGFDIYISRISGNSFSSPTNAGGPINSSADEYFYFSLPNSNIAYFSSDRSGGEGGLDIYMAVPNPYPNDAVVLVQGTVRDANTSEPLGSSIAVTELSSGRKVANLRSDDETGNYYVVLQPGNNYSITSSKPGYVFYTEKFEIPPTNSGYEMTKDIDLSPLAGGKTRLLIFFDFDKFDLKDESKPELERVIEFLRDNPGIKVRIEGHTDDVGTDDYNDKLSLNRANAVKQYLVNAGVESSRISTKGFGKRQPLVKDKTEEARGMNRRVEMKIIE